MRDFSKLTLNYKEGKISFKGSCLEALRSCRAICCRRWVVPISEEEFQLNIYKAQTMCLLTLKNCENDRISCINRIYRLKKRKNGPCVYLDNDSRCSIYENRPKVCQDFSCKGGFHISHALPMTNREHKVKDTAIKYHLGSLKDDMAFILNPLTQLKTLFYLQEKKEIIFLKKIVNKCGLDTSQCNFHQPAINDAILLYLINLFNGKNILQNIHQAVNKKFNLTLSQQEFYEIVGLLISQNIIIYKSQC